MRGKLRNYASRLNLSSADAVLNHARELSKKLASGPQRPFDEQRLSQDILVLLKTPYAHFAIVRALAEMGVKQTKMAVHFGISNSRIYLVSSLVKKTLGKPATLRKFVRRFAEVNYPTLPSFLQHLEKVDQAIRQMPKFQRPVKPRAPVQLSSFAQQVLELAPKFLRGQYQRKEIVREIFKLQDKEPTQLEFNRMLSKVSVVIMRLKQRRLLVGD